MGGWGAKAREMVGDVNVKVKVRFGKENENRKTDDNQPDSSVSGRKTERVKASLENTAPQ